MRAAAAAAAAACDAWSGNDVITCTHCRHAPLTHLLTCLLPAGL